jgi:CBS-domain-containing membrane protein
MQIFNVTHPPGGATAVLAVSITAIHDLDWFYVAQMAGASGIMLAWGLVINNIGKRRYPSEYFLMAVPSLPLSIKTGPPSWACRNLHQKDYADMVRPLFRFICSILDITSPRRKS